jgi:hypothetical protein
MRGILLTLAVLFALSAYAEDGDWRENFNETYRLDETQCLKRIAKPFIPERENYYRDAQRHSAGGSQDPPAYYCFFWKDGKLNRWGEGWAAGDKQSVRSIMDFVLQMKTYEYEMPDELASFKMDGDWIVDPDAQPALKLAALCEIIRSANGPSFAFQEKQMPRDVVIATGEFLQHPLENIHHPQKVHLYVGEPDANEGAGGGSGDLKEFLEMLGTRLGMPVIDQVSGDRPARFSWGHHGSTNFEKLAGLPAGQEKDTKITELLELVSKQTELHFKRELQMVPVWVAEPLNPK